MIKVGLTGNIGSGKSTIAKVFETLSVPVFYADDEAKKILNSESVINQLISLWGKDILTSKEVNRQKLASIVFTNPSELDKLNSIIHPLVKITYSKWLDDHNDYKYVVQEAAIIIENDSYKSFDKIILVTAPEDIRLQRVISRDNTTEVAVQQRMKNQMSEVEKREYAHFIINNDGSTSIIEQVLKIHKSLI